MVRTAIDGVAIPTLPMSEMRETQAFYERLGFHTAYWHMDPAQYLILRRDELEISVEHVDLGVLDRTADVHRAVLTDLQDHAGSGNDGGFGRTIVIHKRKRQICGWPPGELVSTSE